MHQSSLCPCIRSGDRACRCVVASDEELREECPEPALVPWRDDCPAGTPLVCDVHVGPVELAHGVGIGGKHDGTSM